MPRYPDLTPPNLNPDPSVIWVEGRSPTLYWDGPSRREFGRFLELANKYGLHVHEADALDDSPRRRWATKRVYLDEALDAIKRFPGMHFNDWAKAWEEGAQPTKVDAAKARARASVALSRLLKDGKVHKYRMEDGTLLLYPYGMGPLRESPFEQIPHAGP